MANNFITGAAAAALAFVVNSAHAGPVNPDARVGVTPQTLEAKACPRGSRKDPRTGRCVRIPRGSF